MAGAKEIRTKIASVQSTQKITKAMEMVAASKMRKTQERMSSSRPYSDTIRYVISHVSKGSIGYKHLFLEEKKAEDIKNVGYIIVSTDRGLCGGLNINLFKRVLNEIKSFNDRGVNVQLSLIGSKAINFFQSMNFAEIISQTSGVSDTPSVEELIGTVNTMVEAYRKGEVDAVYLVYNKFVNTMLQKPILERLLPLPALENDGSQSGLWDYIYEPDPKVLLDNLLIRYIESQVYQAVVENLASEQAARMVAMKAATDNAGNLINDLQLVYNKARQASITNELNEIVAGAAAI
ncbi:ATP F0F1 synthase subunit gamma [Gallibacterium genomosp. 2]|uniref:ATP synthase gamma chain n=1 Tax=Gallibacterium genomosp. 2 TaxID=155517 RepID=A0A0A2XF62_9PAST|nr:F0F1 ATP synthase subunit gamma [Gallibacterium genomosp. 2]KGQ30788.1 ATP F0F1 synthase subunit gamma [Gallibacterium genomosp. 2]